MKFRNARYIGSENRQSLIDFEIPYNFNNQIVVFIHGFMGFKDWGAWNLVQDFFTNKGFGFCKFNLTHNGGTIEDGIDFPDEEAFGLNTYSKELNDLDCVLNWIENHNLPIKKTHLIGHSRGGGIALIAASTNKRISSVVSWAGISDIGARFPSGKELEEWKRTGVRYVQNGRTKQNLPQYYSLYEDYIQNQAQLSIEMACLNLKIPVSVMHGCKDTSVLPQEGELNAKRLNVSLELIENADHVFGASHPWNSNDLPAALKKTCERTLMFFEKVS